MGGSLRSVRSAMLTIGKEYSCGMFDGYGDRPGSPEGECPAEAEWELIRGEADR